MKLIYTLLILIILPITGYFVALHNHDENLILNAFVYGYGIPIVITLVGLVIWSSNRGGKE